MSITVRLRLNGTVVAMSATAETADREHTGLRFLGAIDGPTEIVITFENNSGDDDADEAFRIPPNQMQWVYKLYDSSYPLITSAAGAFSV